MLPNDITAQIIKKMTVTLQCLIVLQAGPAPERRGGNDGQRQIIQKLLRRDGRFAEPVFFAQMIVSDPEKQDQRQKYVQRGITDLITPMLSDS